MRKKLVALACALQALYLVSMAADRELLVRTGETVMLRTAPVDPRDPFRGDFVTLRYDINSVSQEALRGDIARQPGKPHVPVYAALRPMPGSGDLFELDHLSDRRPASGVFLAGKTVRDWRFPAPQQGVAVRYGIEKLFVEQGQGLAIENRQGRRDGMQIPMEIELAVGRDGDAAIRGFRWSPIGIQLELTRVAQPGPADAVPAEAPVAHVTLQNVSDQTWWLVDSGDHCSFRVLPAGWGAELPPADAGCDDIGPTGDDLVRLGPDESYRVVLDLEQPRWHVLVDGEAMSIARGEEPGALYRIAYRPDVARAASLVVPEGLIWLVELPSAAFSVSGRVD